MTLPRAGIYEISGIAWSGAGRIRRVEVSADGGATWAEAALTGEERPHALVRFRLPWEWTGQAVVLQSRATDEKGRVQPPRKEFIARFAPDIRFHNNSIVSWAVGADGRVTNVYA
jgi:sulfane dehydrogenase subunit SoxC